jgi:hypothetical protein
MELARLKEQFKGKLEMADTQCKYTLHLIHQDQSIVNLYLTLHVPTRYLQTVKSSVAVLRCIQGFLLRVLLNW